MHPNEIAYPCKIDGTRQPALYWRAAGDGPRPLLVALHTWSYDHTDGYAHYAEYCLRHNWHLIFPKFRGPNWTPEACGSEYAVSDLEDAVRFVQGDAPVDGARVYLCGGSGGGHATLLMAGRRPDLWTAVSAWCPIADVAAWHRESRERGNEYAGHIERACGGDPNASAAAMAEARKRSPLTWLPNAIGALPVDINTGIHDGHGGNSVPVSQAIRAFNLLARPEERIPEEVVRELVATEAVPTPWRTAVADPAYGEHHLLLRRISGLVRLTIFEGGHDLLPYPAMEWLSRQRRGEEPSWTPGRPPAESGEATRLTR